MGLRPLLAPQQFWFAMDLRSLLASETSGDGLLGGAFDGLTTLGTLDGAPVTHCHCDIGIVRCSMSLRFCAKRLCEVTSTHACLYLHICVHKHIDLRYTCLHLDICDHKHIDLIYWYVHIRVALH